MYGYDLPVSRIRQLKRFDTNLQYNHSTERQCCSNISWETWGTKGHRRNAKQYTVHLKEGVHLVRHYTRTLKLGTSLSFQLLYITLLILPQKQNVQVVDNPEQISTLTFLNLSHVKTYYCALLHENRFFNKTLTF